MVQKTGAHFFASSYKGTSMLLSQFVKNPRTIGSLVPSSRALSREMVGATGGARDETIVELGPGTGPFTALLYAAMRDKAKYVGIELNPQFYQHLRQRFPLFRFFNQSASSLGAILQSVGTPAVDRIICGLPWASLPGPIQDDIMAEVLAHLAPGGTLVTFAYLQGFVLPSAWRFRKKLNSGFSTVRTSRIVWNNFPPAFVYICTK